MKLRTNKKIKNVNNKIINLNSDDDDKELIVKTREKPEIYLVYPFERNASDAITIYKADLTRLEPAVYLNDNLIDVRIKTLIADLMTEHKSKIHYFTCLFYGKLLEVKEPEKRHKTVCRWTKNVDLFKMDFIIIPINFVNHWSLCVVLQPWHILEQISENSSAYTSVDSSCRLIFLDSCGDYHDTEVISEIIKDYLFYEWIVKYKITLTTAQTLSKKQRFFSIVHGFRASSPQQPNGYDCGVYVIKNVEVMFSIWSKFTETEWNNENISILFRHAFTQQDVVRERCEMRSIFEEVHRLYVSNCKVPVETEVINVVGSESEKEVINVDGSESEREVISVDGSESDSDGDEICLERLRISHSYYKEDYCSSSDEDDFYSKLASKRLKVSVLCDRSNGDFYAADEEDDDDCDEDDDDCR
jgi:Ulp1 family protease